MKVLLLAAISLMLTSLGCQAQIQERALNIGYQPSAHQIAEIAAMEYGWWLQDLRPFGVTAVKEFGYPSGESEMQAMIKGNLDIACIGIAPVIQAIDKGLDAKVIAAVDLQGSNLMLKPGLRFIGPQSLIGLNIATFPQSSVQDLVLRKC